MLSIENYDIYAFDCDGVLLDTNPLKLECFHDAFKKQDLDVDSLHGLVEFFSNNFGHTRKFIFGECERVLESAGVIDAQEKCTAAMEYYTSKMSEIYFNAPVIPETALFIANLSSQNRVVVISGSVQSELRKYLPPKIQRLLSSDVFGGPSSKLENFKMLLNRSRESTVIFFGDAVEDARIASELKVDFIGLTKYSATPRILKEYCLSNSLNCHSVLEVSHV